MNKENKISVRDIYATTFNYVKGNIALLLLIGISFLLNYFYDFVKELRKTGDRTNIYITLLVVIVIPIINGLISVTVLQCIRNISSKEKFVLSNLFAKCRSFIWNYFVNYIKLGLIGIIPIIILIASFLNKSPIQRSVSQISALVLLLLIQAKFAFAPLIPIVLGEKQELFDLSSNLVKGNFDKVFFILLPYNIIGYSGMILKNFTSNITIFKTINLLGLITSPFVKIIMAVTLIKLASIPFNDNQAMEVIVEEQI